MNHTIAIVVELGAGVVLLLTCILWKSCQAERWVMNALLCIASAFLLSGIMGAIIYWHLVRISPHQFTVAVSVKSAIGGIALGILLTLLLSGQMRKLIVLFENRFQQKQK